MFKTKLVTSIRQDLYSMAKAKVAEEGLEGMNAIIEKALRIYLANCSVVVWEKELQGNWIKKLVVRPDKVIFETIRIRKIHQEFDPTYYTDEKLEEKGWKKVWKCKGN